MVSVKILIFIFFRDGYQMREFEKPLQNYMTHDNFLVRIFCQAVKKNLKTSLSSQM